MIRQSWGACLLVLLSAAMTKGDDSVVYFRSDAGTTNSAAQALPDDLAAPGVIVWRQPLAKGHSTPTVYRDAIYLTTFTEDKQLNTVALDRRTGAVRWTQTAPAKRLEEYHPTGSPATCTVACDGERVYSFFGSYGLLCYDLTGKLLWSRELGPFQDEFGSGSSPILVDGKLLLNEDHDVDSFLLCVDAATGKTLWQTRRDGFTRSYATPVVSEFNGQKQVLVAGALQFVSYDLATGKQLWSLDGLARIVNTTPYVERGVIYIATWSPGGDTGARIAMEPWETALKLWDKDGDQKLTRTETDNKEVLDRFYRIDLNQDTKLDEAEWKKYAKVFELAKNSIMAVRPPRPGDDKPEVLWQYEKGIPYVASPLVYREVTYLVKDGGIITTLDANSGKLLKQARGRGTGNYYSSPVAADGKVFLVSEAGVMTALTAQGKWEVLSSYDFGERTVATPTVVDGQIYVRTEAAIYCLAKPRGP